MTDTRPIVSDLRAGVRLTPQPTGLLLMVMRVAYVLVRWAILGPLLLVFLPFWALYFTLALVGTTLRPVADFWRDFSIRAAVEAQLGILLIAGKARLK